MYFQVYLRNNIVYVPTVGKMGVGFYRGVEPVTVISADDTQQVRNALATTIARGNPDVPMLARRNWPAPVLLKYAGVKTWSVFERGMSFWGMEQKKDIWRIIGKQEKSDGTTIDDPQQTISFAPGASVAQVIDCMVAILQHEAKE